MYRNKRGDQMKRLIYKVFIYFHAIAFALSIPACFVSIGVNANNLKLAGVSLVWAIIFMVVITKMYKGILIRMQSPSRTILKGMSLYFLLVPVVSKVLGYSPEIIQPLISSFGFYYYSKIDYPIYEQEIRYEAIQ
jgi:hypothetical protein